MPKKFELKQKELLPPLTKDQVGNLIKFMKLNASRLIDMSNFESCCEGDDADVYMGYVYDALRLGYSTPEEIGEYLKYEFGEDDEDEDDE